MSGRTNGNPIEVNFTLIKNTDFFKRLSACVFDPCANRCDFQFIGKMKLLEKIFAFLHKFDSFEMRLIRMRPFIVGRASPIHQAVLRRSVFAMLIFFFAIGAALHVRAHQKTASLDAPLKFTDVTKAAGLYRETSGASATFVDFDDDGWLDLHLINRHYEPSLLYRNQRDGTFIDVTAASGLRFQTDRGGAFWVDVDNDGDKDCLTAGSNQDELFMNNGDLAGQAGTFSSWGSLIGRAGTGRGGGMAVADFDNDGLVDIFVCQTDNSPRHYPADRSLLFKNLGEGKFQEVGRTAGLADSYDAGTAVWLDFNQDGWVDLITASSVPPLFNAFRNNRNGTFQQATAEAGLAEAEPRYYTRFGLYTPDLNSDGNTDLILIADSLRFYLQQSNRFRPRPVESLLSLPKALLPIGAMTWADANNDGWRDWFMIVHPGATQIRLGQKTGRFAESGVLKDETSSDFGMALGDYDNDGDLDLFLARQGASKLYRNDSPPQNWLQLQLRGTASNASGFGAKVNLYAGGRRQTVEVQMTGALHFGLGNSSQTDSIQIRWPSGQFQKLTKVKANQKLDIKEPISATFEEVTNAAGISGARQSRGAAFADYDNDGDLDLVVNGGPGLLFNNKGDGTFTEVAEKAGIYIISASAGGVAWGDFNNDGRLDLFMTRESRLPHRLLLANPDATFTDVSPEAGVALPSRRGGPVLLADFDANGFLDILIPSAEPVQLFLNQGNTTFLEAAERAGFASLSYKKHITGCTGDYDNDGDIDVYLANSNWSYKKHDAPNYLFRNRSDLAGQAGTFEEVTTAAGVADSSNSKGAVFGDYDNDGDLDLYVANDGGDNRLFRNNGDGTFTDVARQAGVAGPFAAHSPAFGDFDNDGDLDLYVTGASFLYYDSLEVSFGPLPDVLYRNDGFEPTRGWTFTEVTAEMGIENPASCIGAIWGDIDNDGDLDLFLANSHDLRGRKISASLFNEPPFPENKLYRNRGNRNHYLHLKLVSHRSNRAAIGARIEAYAGDLIQIREVEGGSTHGSQNSLRLAFGFGKRDKVDKVIVRWPSGIVQTINKPKIEQVLVVEEPFKAGPILIERATLARARWWLPRVVGSLGGLIFIAALILIGRRGYHLMRRKISAYQLRPLHSRLKLFGARRIRRRAETKSEKEISRQRQQTSLVKVIVNLIEFKNDYLLTHRVEPVHGFAEELPAFSPGRHEKHPYTIRVEKLRHLQKDVAEVFRSYEAYMLRGHKSEISPAEELRQIGRRIYRFFGLGGLFGELFQLPASPPIHLQFVLDSPQVPWHLAYDEKTGCFLFERFPYGVSFATEKMPLALFRGPGQTPTIDFNARAVVLFYGDWRGAPKELKEVGAEIQEVEKIVRQAGIEAHLIHQDVDQFAQAILQMQNHNKNLRLIHYCGHVEGNMLAAGKEDYLAAGFLKEAFGLSLPSKPIVFLNGCSSGSLANLWERYENLATEFLACGAAACIVTDFPVAETAARNFALCFYHHVVHEGKTAGEALRCARVALGKRRHADDLDPEYDVTRYFYNLYGDPTARL
jgi:hypothetical protein